MTGEITDFTPELWLAESRIAFIGMNNRFFKGEPLSEHDVRVLHYFYLTTERRLRLLGDLFLLAVSELRHNREHLEEYAKSNGYII